MNEKRANTSTPLPPIEPLRLPPEQVKPARDALVIALYYSIFGFLWIAVTDTILEALVTNLQVQQTIQLIKGWIFVALTVGIIYFLVYNRLLVIQKYVAKVIETTTILGQTKEALLVQKAITEEIIGQSPVLITIWDSQGNLKSINPYALELLGYDNSEAFREEWLSLIMDSTNRANLQNVFLRLIKQERLLNYETELVTKSGAHLSILWNSGAVAMQNSGETEYVSFGIDITEKKEVSRKLEYLAYHDYLTDLPNRVALEHEVDSRFSQRKDPFALLYIDLDNFKYINDSLGHQVGDELLIYVSKVFKQYVKPPHYVARLGGDEFSVLFSPYVSKQQLLQWLSGLEKQLGKTWQIFNHSFYLSFSIGIALSHQHGHDFLTLSKQADIAMYRAKNEGKDQVMFYSDSIENDNLEQLDMAKRLQSALDKGAFELHYQPQYNIQTTKIVGREALLRWNDDERGPVSPATFIPFAEESGQIFAIDRFVFIHALQQKLLWDQSGTSDLTLSINLSSKTLVSDVNFAEIESILQLYTGDLSKIVVEFTETAVIKDMNAALANTTKLRKLGVQIALDDFGTGYSSLTHIKVLPIQMVKLDRNFINQIHHNGKDEIIVRSMIELLTNLGYSIVAEGIENAEQQAYLVKNGCQLGQGYLLSKPLSVSAFNELLTKLF